MKLAEGTLVKARLVDKSVFVCISEDMAWWMEHFFEKYLHGMAIVESFGSGLYSSFGK